MLVVLVSCNSVVWSCKLLLGNVYSSLAYTIKLLAKQIHFVFQNFKLWTCLCLSGREYREVSHGDRKNGGRSFA